MDNLPKAGRSGGQTGPRRERKGNPDGPPPGARGGGEANGAGSEPQSSSSSSSSSSRVQTGPPLTSVRADLMESARRGVEAEGSGRPVSKRKAEALEAEAPWEASAREPMRDGDGKGGKEEEGSEDEGIKRRKAVTSRAGGTWGGDGSARVADEDPHLAGVLSGHAPGSDAALAAAFTAALDPRGGWNTARFDAACALVWPAGRGIPEGQAQERLLTILLSVMPRASDTAWPELCRVAIERSVRTLGQRGAIDPSRFLRALVNAANAGSDVDRFLSLMEQVPMLLAFAVRALKDDLARPGERQRALRATIEALGPQPSAVNRCWIALRAVWLLSERSRTSLTSEALDFPFWGDAMRQTLETLRSESLADPAAAWPLVNLLVLSWEALPSSSLGELDGSSAASCRDLLAALGQVMPAVAPHVSPASLLAWGALLASGAPRMVQAVGPEFGVDALRKTFLAALDTPPVPLRAGGDRKGERQADDPMEDAAILPRARAMGLLLQGLDQPSVVTICTSAGLTEAEIRAWLRASDSWPHMATLPGGRRPLDAPTVLVTLPVSFELRWDLLKAVLVSCPPGSSARVSHLREAVFALAGEEARAQGEPGLALIDERLAAAYAALMEGSAFMAAEGAVTFAMPVGPDAPDDDLLETLGGIDELLWFDRESDALRTRPQPLPADGPTMKLLRSGQAVVSDLLRHSMGFQNAREDLEGLEREVDRSMEDPELSRQPSGLTAWEAQAGDWINRLQTTQTLQRRHDGLPKLVRESHLARLEACITRIATRLRSGPALPPEGARRAQALLDFFLTCATRGEPDVTAGMPVIMIRLGEGPVTARDLQQVAASLAEAGSVVLDAVPVATAKGPCLARLAWMSRALGWQLDRDRSITFAQALLREAATGHRRWRCTPEDAQALGQALAVEAVSEVYAQATVPERAALLRQALPPWGLRPGRLPPAWGDDDQRAAWVAGDHERLTIALMSALPMDDLGGVQDLAPMAEHLALLAADYDLLAFGRLVRQFIETAQLLTDTGWIPVLLSALAFRAEVPDGHLAVAARTAAAGDLVDHWFGLAPAAQMRLMAVLCDGPAPGAQAGFEAAVRHRLVHPVAGDDTAALACAHALALGVRGRPAKEREAWSQAVVAGAGAEDPGRVRLGIRMAWEPLAVIDADGLSRARKLELLGRVFALQAAHDSALARHALGDIQAHGQVSPRERADLVLSLVREAGHALDDAALRGARGALMEAALEELAATASEDAAVVGDRKAGGPPASPEADVDGKASGAAPATLQETGAVIAEKDVLGAAWLAFLARVARCRGLSFVGERPLEVARVRDRLEDVRRHRDFVAGELKAVDRYRMSPQAGAWLRAEIAGQLRGLEEALVLAEPAESKVSSTR